MKRVDHLLLLVILALLFFGLLMIYDASSVSAFRDFNGDKYHYIKDQLIYTILGLVTLFGFSVYDYRRLQKRAFFFLICAIVLLVGVFIPGIGIFALGAHRWVNLQLFILQPAEFVKLSLAIYLGAWFARKEKKQFLSFTILVGIILLLVMTEPDMGTASIILAEVLAVYFLSGSSIKQFVVLLPVIFLLGLLFILIEPYRLARLTAFLNVGQSLSGASYHVKQILIALGNGGLFGVGLGNSLQKYAYLPEEATDSIFAIIAEELGFFGSSILVLLFGIVIWRGFFIAARVKDMFGKLLAAGIITFIGIQIIVNLGAMTVLLPLTGVPLPFISYGGSALIIDLASIGILLNISRHISEEKRA